MGIVKSTKVIDFTLSTKFDDDLSLQFLRERSLKLKMIQSECWFNSSTSKVLKRGTWNSN
jgi:hypothetical protein